MKLTPPSVLLVLLVLAAFGADRPPDTHVSSWEELKVYTGRGAYQKIEGQLRQKTYLAVYDGLQQLYGGTVDGQLHEEVVLLCPETADFLYSGFTPTEVDYRQGSRPVLEAKVREVTAGCTTERQKVLALLRNVRDLYQQPGDESLSSVLGGTEEQLLDARPRWCELQSRLLVALCQVAGFPARRVGHFIGGHAVSEIYFEDRWAYIDIRGIYFLKPDGKFASTWDIWTHPEWIELQDDEVKADRVRDGDPRLADIYRWESTLKRFFHPNEVTAIMNYNISQAAKYNYRLVDRTKKPAVGQAATPAHQEVGAWRDRIFAGER